MKRKANDPRPGWDEYFMEIAQVVAKRSNCSRRQVAGLDECLCVHAEQNAICQAARYGLNVAGGTIYVTISPCLTCAKLIVNAGISRVVYGGDYTAFLDTVKAMFREAHVKFQAFAKPKRK